MLLQLRGRHLRPLGPTSPGAFVGRVCEDANLDPPARSRELLLLREPTDRLPSGFRGYLLHTPVRDDTPMPADAYELGTAMRYLAHGDVVGSIRNDTS